MKIVFLILLLTANSMIVKAQLKLGTAKSEINFREGPGLNYRIVSTIDHSNLLVILPREPQNNFIEVFDIETSSTGYVSENLIGVTDTLMAQRQRFFEKSGSGAIGEVEIELINKTSKTLFVWINKNSYNLFPFEKKLLIMNTEEITFFSSAPGLFPVFGKEILKMGSTYRWIFSL